MSEKVFEVKTTEAEKLVNRYMWWSLGAGLIPVPWVDMVAVSSVQIKMVADISKIYDISFSENSGKTIVTSLLGSVVPDSLARGSVGSLLKTVPVVGTILGAMSMSIFSAATTYAIGKVFIQHFESGGTFLDFDPAQVREYYKSQFEEGKDIAEKMSKKKSPDVGA